MIDAFHHQGGVVRKRVIVGEGAGVDLHARDGRLGRARGPDDADRRRARLACGAAAARRPRASGAILMVAGRGRRHRRPCSARRSAPRCSPSRSSTATTSSRDALIPARPRQRRRVLGRHLDLRRVDAVRACPHYPVHPRRTCRSTRCWRCWCRCWRSLFLVVAAHRAAASTARCPSRAGRGPASAGSRSACSACRSSGSSARASRNPGRGSASSAAATAPSQVAITGVGLAADGWAGVGLLAAPVLAQDHRVVAHDRHRAAAPATSRPSLVIGGLFGGAFGRAAQIAAPRSAHRSGRASRWSAWARSTAASPTCRCRSLVMVCELAGSYDLLVPLMLAEGIAFVALRHRSLYHAQVPTQRDSPAHQHGDVRRPALDARRRCPGPRPPVSQLRAGDAGARHHATDRGGALAGRLSGAGRGGNDARLITADTLRFVGTQREAEAWMIATDIMQAPVTGDRKGRPAGSRPARAGQRAARAPGRGGRQAGSWVSSMKPTSPRPTWSSLRKRPGRDYHALRQ